MNVLAIGAHFDDVELGCGGALAKHVAKGDKVVVYVATVSGFSNHRNSEVRSNDVAQAEGEAAMRALGIEHLICGSFKTLEVEFVDPLNIEILRIIEDHQIDMVYTHWIGDIHHDHQAVGRAALHSSRHVPRLLMYRSNWYHSPMEFRGNFYVDITATWEKKRDAILAHASEVERTGRKWISFFENEAENAGQRIGRHYAEVFEVLKWID
jgi:LmbE family N-acetylglucosaminyl deacetylase